jgi:hypothetical protein
MKRRRWVWGVCALVAILVGADTAAWWMAERALARGLANWTAAMAAEGWTVQAGPPSLAGWPLAATTVVPALRIGTGPLAVATQGLAITASPLHPATLRVTFPAPVVLDLPMLPPVSLTASQAGLDAPLRGPPWASIDVKDLQAQWTGTDGVVRVLTVPLVHLRFEPTLEGLAVTGSAQAITLPEPRPGEVMPLGRRLASVSFDATLRRGLPAAPMTTQSLAAWRDAGGALMLQRLAVGYGPLGIAGQGRFGLDQRLQPSGEATVQVLGYAQTLQALATAHLITSHESQTVGAVLALLARTPEGGGTPRVDVTVSLQNQTVTIAGFPLLRVPAINWPDGG